MSDITFEDLNLAPEVHSAVQSLGYETPTPIQAQTIPVLLNGQDLLAQAQTGTGKTAAFALPILTKLDLAIKSPQAIIIAPTRELAIQVAEAFQRYAKNLPGFHIVPIYGGQDYRVQLKALKRGMQVIVGTPGRIMDHMERKTIDCSHLKILILDEADEMLKMGFIDAIEWILEQLPEERQVGLFSATIPPAIANVAKKYLNNPAKISIKSKTATVSTIQQYGILLAQHHKLEAVTRLLEVEEFEAVIIFTRTKNASDELAEKLESRGYRVAAINGDLKQSQRERVINDLKNNKLDIIVATDVAARGLDLTRLSHVINYDMPHDTESYVHRIGRTGRAGRSGKSFLLATPKEQRMLQDIMRATNQPIEMIDLPSVKDINTKRAKNFADEVRKVLENADLENHHIAVNHLMNECEASLENVAAALYSLLQKNHEPLQDIAKPAVSKPSDSRRERARSSDRSDRPRREEYRGKPRASSEGRESGERNFRTRSPSDRRSSEKPTFEKRSSDFAPRKAPAEFSRSRSDAVPPRRTPEFKSAAPHARRETEFKSARPRSDAPSSRRGSDFKPTKSRFEAPRVASGSDFKSARGFSAGKPSSFKGKPAPSFKKKTSTSDKPKRR